VPRFGVSILQEQQLARKVLVNAQADHQPGGQQTIRQEAADAVDATRGPSFAADQDESPQRGSGRPIPPLASKIQVATTNEGSRAQGDLTPEFLTLSTDTALFALVFHFFRQL
jgi:hypothetical protein